MLYIGMSSSREAHGRRHVSNTRSQTFDKSMLFSVSCYSNYLGWSFKRCQSTEVRSRKWRTRAKVEPRRIVLGSCRTHCCWCCCCCVHIQTSLPSQIKPAWKVVETPSTMPKIRSVQVMPRHLWFTGIRRPLFSLPPPGHFFFQHQGGGDYAWPPPLELRRERVEKRLPFALRCRPLLQFVAVRCGEVASSALLGYRYQVTEWYVQRWCFRGTQTLALLVVSFSV